MSDTYKLFSNGQDVVGIECPSCLRVLSVRRSTLANAGSGALMTGTPVLCKCGFSSRSIFVAQPHSHPSSARKHPSGAHQILQVAAVLAFGGCALAFIHPCQQPEVRILDSMEQIYGQRPLVVERGGVIIGEPALLVYLKHQLKDPDSLEMISIGDAQPYDGKAGKGWAVSAKFRARNSFNGFVIEEGTYLFRGDDVVAVLSERIL
jgi:hypothetical protein